MKKIFKPVFSLHPISITIWLTLTFLVVFLIGVPILDFVEWKTYDLRFLSRGIKQPSQKVVLATIDEKSLNQEGRWPWPRARIADLIEILSEDGAKVISIDVVFSEPDQNTQLKLIRQFDEKVQALETHNQALIDFVRDIEVNADNDLVLARAIERSRAKVVLGYFLQDQTDLKYKIEEDEITDQLKRISNSRYSLIRSFGRRDIPFDPFLYFYAPESPIEPLAQAANASGYVSITQDPDGVIRWMPLIFKCREELFMPLSIQSLWHYLDRPMLMVRMAEYGVEGIQMGELFIPTDENGQILINYLGPPLTFPHYSVSDILHRRLPKGTFSGKIVLIGATAKGTYDLRNTPYSPDFPGPEVHATVMDNILRQAFLSKPKWTRLYDLLAIVVLGVLTGIALPRLGAVKGILFALGLCLLHILLGRWLFIHYGLWVNLVYPLLTVLLIYTSLTLFYYITEERERKKIKGAFSHYVSRSVVNEMLKDPGNLKLGGDKRELSVLFSDIRGFTTISEGLSPEDLVHLLNEYLTVMTDIVFKYDGTLDKYMGDALMAIFGAPVEQTDHARRACAASLEMMEGLKKLNEKWLAEGKSALDIGIGINTGMMMVGNMGSEQIFDYTVMGDAVNLGSRLEGVNKSYNTNILVSESTCQSAGDQFTFMELDSVRVKGKSQMVRIYQLLGGKDLDGMTREAVQYFQKGLRFYRQQKWDKALDAFYSVTAMDKNIRAAGIYIQRCLELKSSSPGPDWDGVYTMKDK